MDVTRRTALQAILAALLQALFPFLRRSPRLLAAGIAKAERLLFKGGTMRISIFVKGVEIDLRQYMFCIDRRAHDRGQDLFFRDPMPLGERVGSYRDRLEEVERENARTRRTQQMQAFLLSTSNDRARPSLSRRA